MDEIKEVRAFNGSKARFPSAIFVAKADALDWMGNCRLTDMLTKYSVGVSIYKWSIENRNFKAKSEKDWTPDFIGNFRVQRRSTCCRERDCSKCVNLISCECLMRRFTVLLDRDLKIVRKISNDGKNRSLRIDGKELLGVLRDVEYMLISLHKIGAYYAPELPDRKSKYNAETTKFIDEGEVTKRLARIRSTLTRVFDDTRGEDDLTDIERALEGLQFWSPGSKGK